MLTNLDLRFRIESGVQFLECEIYDFNKYINKYLENIKNIVSNIIFDKNKF